MRWLAVILLCSACIVTREPAPESAAPAPAVELDTQVGDWVRYRILAKDDFLASSSNSLWGNIAHGAEICTAIAPPDDPGGDYHAVMQRECSFWNKVIGPAGTIGRLAGAIAGVPVIAPKKQPDWYILQHEQIHFAINEVAARTLSGQLKKLAPDRRAAMAPRLLQMTRTRANARQREFDQATSGTFDPDDLEYWVRVLEAQMKRLCGNDSDCEVRTPD